ncbi:MAG: hypothetical protein AAFO79_09395 [Pseudomonadota bacterium]
MAQEQDELSGYRIMHRRGRMTPRTRQARPIEMGGSGRDRYILSFILAGLIGAAGWVLWQDFQTLTGADLSRWQPQFKRQEPLPMTPPGSDDQLRPYLPRTRPVTRSARPALTRVQPPGYSEALPETALAERMVFRRGTDGRASAVGRIESGTAGDLERFLAAQGSELKEVVLHSPGGSVRDALSMARQLRALKVTTRVPDNGYCASSCPLVLSGGVERTAGAPVWIGVHQVATAQGEVGTLQQGIASAQNISAQCQQLLVDMGVDPRVWILAMATPHAQLHVMTAQELTELKLLTEAPKER